MIVDITGEKRGVTDAHMRSAFSAVLGPSARSNDAVVSVTDFINVVLRCGVGKLVSKLSLYFLHI